MRRLLTFLIASSLATPGLAASNGYRLNSDGQDITDSKQLPVKNFCSNDSGATWIPCVPSTGGGGGGGAGTADSTAANQATQITAANLSNTRLGDITSPATGSVNYRLNSILSGLGAVTLTNTGFGATQSGTWNITNVSGTVSLPTGAATGTRQDTGNVSLASIDTKMSAATPAGDFHIGEVGSNQITISNALTVTASSAYASGNAVGGLMTLANASRNSGSSGSPGTSGLVQSSTVSVKSAQTGAADLIIFGGNPTASTCTDKTAFSVAAADFDKIVGVLHVTDWTSLGTPSVGQAQQQAMPFDITTATLYACLVTRSTPTFASTSDVTVRVRILRN